MERGTDFLMTANSRVLQLVKEGVKNLSLTNFCDHGDMIDISFAGKIEKKFTISTDGKMFFLEGDKYRKSGGRPAFALITDMVDYLLVLTNGGQISGKLMLPGEAEKKFVAEPAVFPT